jgi:hypothetical protein
MPNARIEGYVALDRDGDRAARARSPRQQLASVAHVAELAMRRTIVLRVLRSRSALSLLAAAAVVGLGMFGAPVPAHAGDSRIVDDTQGAIVQVDHRDDKRFDRDHDRRDHRYRDRDRDRDHRYRDRYRDNDRRHRYRDHDRYRRHDRYRDHDRKRYEHRRDHRRFDRRWDRDRGRRYRS